MNFILVWFSVAAVNTRTKCFLDYKRVYVSLHFQVIVTGSHSATFIFCFFKKASSIWYSIFQSYLISESFMLDTPSIHIHTKSCPLFKVLQYQFLLCKYFLICGLFLEISQLTLLMKTFSLFQQLIIANR